MDESLRQLYFNIAKLHRCAEWTYKTQYSQAEKYHGRNNRLNISAIILTGSAGVVATSSGVAQLLGWNNWDLLCTFGAALISTIGTIILSCCKNLNYSEKIPQNIEIGAKLRRIYIDYENLLTDIKARKCNYDGACKRRQEILDRETKLYEQAPLTFTEAVKLANEKLNKRGDNEFGESSLMSSLPDYLRI